MQQLKKYLVVLFLLLITLCFLISCNEASDYVTGTDVSISEPSFETATGEEKELVEAKIQIDTYKIRMIPKWTVADTGVPIYGSTEGKGVNDKKEYIDYITIHGNNLSNIGYYTQGIWEFSLIALHGDKEVYKVPEKLVEINNNSRTIPIDPSEIKYSEKNASCSVELTDFDILLVDELNNYIAEDYKVTVAISPVTIGGTVVDEFDITSNVTSSNGVTGIIKDYAFTQELSPGTYVISVYFYQKNENGVLTKDGGTSYGFTAIPGATLIIKGTSPDEIDLYPNRFKSIGTNSGIIIDSGVDATISIEAAVNSNALQTSTVNEKDVVAFTGKVNGTVTSGRWFVNGEPQSTTGKTFEYNTTGMAGKTVTITYMIMDSSYNSISTNYYLKVEAASSTT